MSTAIQVVPPAMPADITPEERALLTNDLNGLAPEQRAALYKNVCTSLGLNPLTQPFSYITLNGKLTLYAKKDATDQLRASRGISVRIDSKEVIGDLYIVTVSASDRTGRTDSEIGAVTIAGKKGDDAANAMMKAITKAKRRATLSICGLGYLDETELDTMPHVSVAGNGGLGSITQIAGDLVNPEERRAIAAKQLTTGAAYGSAKPVPADDTAPTDTARRLLGELERIYRDHWKSEFEPPYDETRASYDLTIQELIKLITAEFTDTTGMDAEQARILEVATASYRRLGVNIEQKEDIALSYGAARWLILSLRAIKASNGRAVDALFTATYDDLGDPVL